MTTLAILKSRIADDLVRDDIDTQITDAVAGAIKEYQGYPFYFNESRDMTFPTVAAQWDYDKTDNANIGLIRRIDAVQVLASGQTTYLSRYDHAEQEYLTNSGTDTARGVPFGYSWFGQVIYLYPIPDAVYTVRVIGLVSRAAPAADDEADNPWMVEGFELIRCRAKAYLAVHTVHDDALANRMAIAEGVALDRIYSEGSRRRGTGRIKATKF